MTSFTLQHAPLLCSIFSEVRTGGDDLGIILGPCFGSGETGQITNGQLTHANKLLSPTQFSVTKGKY